MKSLILSSLIFLSAILTARAEVKILSADGWLESCYVTWSPVEGATNYNVYYRPQGSTQYQRLDSILVRRYADYSRADVLGIKAGQYQMKVVPVNAEGEMTEAATETATLEVKAHDRGGFAHFKTASTTFNPANGVGAYKNDGTLKAGAKVLYVHASNAKTISLEVVTSSKGAKTLGVGLQNIISLYEKGCDKTPLAIRIIGTLRKEDMDALGSSAEGLQIKGRNSYSEMNITLEGVGNDAAIHGFGILMRNACSVEIRNLGIMWCMDDAISMDTDNSNLWIHNLDLFYGQKGSDSDQAKGDGTLDIKGDSKYTTISYNHLWDNGKASLCGMTSESGPNYITYHHNWFDHSDSRHPRVRTMSVHIYNNYYDGVAKYGAGATTGADLFVENNYFRNCKYPMLISLQGSDVHNGIGSKDDTKGTFSGETGGSIKAYGNYMIGQISFEPYKAGDELYSKHFDAYVAQERDEQVPATVVSLSGNDTYSNFDTDPALMYQGYQCDEAAQVPGVVTGTYGAGRCQHGDFTWTFGETEDADYEVIQALSTAILQYQSSLQGFYCQANQTATPSEEEEEDPEPEDPSTVVPASGTEICDFLSRSPSTSMVTVTGNYSTSKGTLTYDGKSYGTCVKMESGTSIVITPKYNCTITLIFGGTANPPANSSFKLDGVKTALDANGCYSFAAEAGKSYTVSKDKTLELFLILFEAQSSSIATLQMADTDCKIFDLMGHPVTTPMRGRTYIINGRKVYYK